MPDDLLSAGDMFDTVSDDGDKMDLATVTERLDKDYSDVSRTVSPTVLAAVSSLTENDVVIDTGAGVSIFKNNDHVYDLYDDNEMIETYGLTNNKKPWHSSVQNVV